MDRFAWSTGWFWGMRRTAWAGPGASNMLVRRVEPMATEVAAGLVGQHDAPGRCGSANRHTDVRGSRPQVGYSQEGAPD
jgi:hypothetical protein